MAPSRIFFWALLAFVSGIAAASFLSVSLPVAALFFAVGGATLFYAFLGPAVRRQFLAAGLALAFGAAGAVRMDYAARPGASAFVPGAQISFEGTVAEEPVRSSSQRLVVIHGESRERIMVTVRLFPGFDYGDEISVSGLIRKPGSDGSDSGYASYLARRGIFRIMRYPRIEKISAKGSRSPAAALISIRKTFSGALNQILPEPHASFVAGLLVGEQRAIPPDIQDQMRKTSTAHMVALSGYNITIIADNLLRALRFFFLPMAWSFAFAAAGVVLFTIMTGASASVVRAAIMGILVLVARGQGRLPYARNILMLAAAAMLALQPDMLRFDLGFQLSFLATLGLVYGSGPLERALLDARFAAGRLLRHAGIRAPERPGARPSREKFPAFVRETIVTTLAAQLFVLPLLVLKFGMVSLIGPVANAFVVPAVPYTMGAGFFAGVLGLVSGRAAALAAWPARLAAEYELGAIRTFARLPGASAEVGPAAGWAVALLAVILILFLLVRFREHGEEAFQ